MANFKLTVFFESEQAGVIGTGSSLGWTENWYKVADKSLDQMIVDPDIGLYLQLRRAIMPDIYRISFIRVSEDDHARRYKIAHVPGGQGSIPGATAGGVDLFPAAQVQCALLVALEKLPALANPTEPSHVRRFLIRGLPAEFISGNVLNPAAANWVKLRQFLDFIGNHPAGQNPVAGQPVFSWGIRYHNPANVSQIVVAAAVSADNNQTIVVTPTVALPATPGLRYRITGVDSPREFNRTWTFLAEKVAAPVPQAILGTSRRKLQGSYTGPGKAKLTPEGFLYGPVDQYAIIGLRNKKTGRVFRQLRGRSSRR